MHHPLHYTIIIAVCSFLASCSPPHAFEVDQKTKELVQHAPTRSIKTWGTLTVPVPQGITVSTNEGPRFIDFYLIYFSREDSNSTGLFIYVGHHPNSRNKKLASKAEPVSLRVMGKETSGYRYQINGEQKIEIITDGAAHDALLHIVLTEGDQKEVFAAILDQMRINSSNEKK